MALEKIVGKARNFAAKGLLASALALPSLSAGCGVYSFPFPGSRGRIDRSELLNSLEEAKQEVSSQEEADAIDVLAGELYALTSAAFEVFAGILSYPSENPFMIGAGGTRGYQFQIQPFHLDNLSPTSHANIRWWNPNIQDYSTNIHIPESVFTFYEPISPIVPTSLLYIVEDIQSNIMPSYFTVSNGTVSAASDPYSEITDNPQYFEDYQDDEGNTYHYEYIDW